MRNRIAVLLRAAPARLADRGTLGLGAALAASSLLLLVGPTHQKPPPPAPIPASVAWPHARTGSIPGTLPDGSAYTPALLFDAHSSVGTAPSRNGRYLRLLWRGPGGSLRQLRRLPAKQDPYFGPVTAAGNVLAWAESSRSGHLQLWTVDLGNGRPARPVTADTGYLQSDDSQYDLTISDGQLHWIASAPGHYDVRQVRSVALTGGRVESRTVPRTWELSAWPWLDNGAGAPTGTTVLRNLVTNQDVAVHHTAGLHTTNCSPTWCQVVTLAADGSTRIELMHPNGAAREPIPGAVEPAIDDVAPLDHFEVLAQTGPDTGLTRNEQLLVFEIATHRTVELSLNAATVVYRGGVLWWSNGGQNVTVWHTVDLRTV
jgi:hypothetical protein